MSRIPAFNLIVDGIPFVANDRLINLCLTDNAGFEADKLTISLSDHDGLLTLPRKGAVIKLALGWQFGLASLINGSLGLVDKGKFVIDEVTHTGVPDKLGFSAHSADFAKGFTEQKDKSWHQKTIGQIIDTIAGEHGWKSACHKGYKDIKIEHIDQTNESDAHFVTRLADKYDALASVKNGSLLFMPHGKGQTASGKAIPQTLITRDAGDQHSYCESDRSSKVTGVRAFYHDQGQAKRKKVEVGEDGYRKQIRTIFASCAEAEAACKAKWQKIRRGGKRFSMTLAYGRAELLASMPAVVAGFKPQIDANKWVIKQLTHNMTESGFTTAVEFEVKID